MTTFFKKVSNWFGYKAGPDLESTRAVQLWKEVFVAAAFSRRQPFEPICRHRRVW